MNKHNLPPEIMAILEKAIQDSQSVFSANIAWQTEIIESVEARCGKSMANTVAISIELMHAMMQMYFALKQSHDLDPMMYESMKQIHSSTVAHMLSLHDLTEEAKDRELNVIIKLLDARFEALTKTEKISREAQEKISKL